MRRKGTGAGLVLALRGRSALVLDGSRRGEARAVAAQGGMDLPGPAQRRGLGAGARRGRLSSRRPSATKVQTTYKENVFSNAQVPQIVAGLVREGYTMIFGMLVREFENGVNGQLCAKYPEVIFEQATGLQIKKNQAEYFGAGEDTIYLSGMAAGAASKKGLIGYVVPFGIPEVVRHINAFTLGAQATHPARR